MSAPAIVLKSKLGIETLLREKKQTIELRHSAKKQKKLEISARRVQLNG